MQKIIHRKVSERYIENVKKVQRYFETLYKPDVAMDKVAVDEMVKTIIDRIEVGSDALFKSAGIRKEAFFL